MHRIKILAVNKHKEIEWTEICESPTKSGATRKANNVIRSCGDPKIEIDKHVIDETYQVWTI